MTALLSKFFIILRGNDLEVSSLIEVWNQNGCFLTHWLPIKSILFRIERICRSQFKCNYRKNKKLFLDFLFHLWNLHQILNISKKRKIIIANVFPKLQTVKEVVRPVSEKRCFRTSFDTQHVKRYQTLAKSAWEDLYHIFSSLWERII